ncbi:hypothetical protein P389DRAFT_166433 [Cystobasidium minutum MCA 4210]|uniref:uncharacterized protein n=1 Tax=Cystobasidium minutum MCA 4210 TaxID=1397322 RepID=UPI0034D01E68|eukprot:jgi/Rhomi1/166433/fgenesh1_kg.1_\
MNTAAGDTALSSIFDIPYQDWNRPHLIRRASNPHRTRAEARGHKYTPSDQNAIAVLRSFIDDEEIARDSLPILGLLIRRPLRRYKHTGRVLTAPNLKRATSMPGRCKQTFVVAVGTVASDDTLPEPESLDDIARANKASGEILSTSHLSGCPTTLSVVDEAGEALTCERCPLILPGMHQYWGTVRIGADGDLFCSNGCPEPGMKRVRRMRPGLSRSGDTA